MRLVHLLWPCAALLACGSSNKEPERPIPKLGEYLNSRPAEPSPPSGAVGAVEGHGDGDSCDTARDSIASEAEAEVPPEHAKAIKDLLNKGTYLNSCGIDSSTAVDVCAAIRDGAAVGVTVKLNPGEQTAADCVADGIRRMEFPSRPELDVARTRFEPGL